MKSKNLNAFNFRFDRTHVNIKVFIAAGQNDKQFSNGLSNRYSSYHSELGQQHASVHWIHCKYTAPCAVGTHGFPSYFVDFIAIVVHQISLSFQITFFLGITILTILASFILYMIFQAPIEDLLRNIYNRKMKY